MVDPKLMTGLGAALAIFLSASGCSLASIPGGRFALMVESRFFLSFVPIIISGVLAIYGMIIGVILSLALNNEDIKMDETDGYRHFAAGLTVGLACLASGWGLANFIKSTLVDMTTGTMSASNATSNEQQQGLLSGNLVVRKPVEVPNPVKLCCVLCFLEAIALYGLIVALIMTK